jgi:hypothetical protein
MASSPRELPTLLSVLGITEEGLSDVSEQQVDHALQKKGIEELAECRRVRIAWKCQQQRSGVLFKFVFAFVSIHVCCFSFFQFSCLIFFVKEDCCLILFISFVWLCSSANLQVPDSGLMFSFNLVFDYIGFRLLILLGIIQQLQAQLKQLEEENKENKLQLQAKVSEQDAQLKQLEEENKENKLQLQAKVSEQNAQLKQLEKQLERNEQITEKLRADLLGVFVRYLFFPYRSCQDVDVSCVQLQGSTSQCSRPKFLVVALCWWQEGISAVDCHCEYTAGTPTPCQPTSSPNNLTWFGQNVLYTVALLTYSSLNNALTILNSRR